MSHIYQILAIIALALLLTTLGIGLWVGDYGAEAAAYQDAKAPLARKLSDPTVAEADKQETYAALKALSDKFAEIRGRQRIHFLLGVLSCLTAILVNSIAVTYFVGTTKWIREVGETYGFDNSFIDRSNKIKRGTFPWAVAGMLSVVAIAALGGMADPGGLMLGQSGLYVTPHFIMAMVGTAIIAWSFYVQVNNIAANSKVIADVMTEVRAAREARGLEVEPVE